MDHVEMNITDENKSNMIRKKSSFLRDGSYRIFHITKKGKEETDDDDDDDERNNNNNNDQTIMKKNKKSLKRTNRNGLKKFFILHKKTCELSLNEIKTPSSSHHETDDLSQSIISNDRTSIKLLKKNKENIQRESIDHLSKINIMDEKFTQNNLVIRNTDKFQTINRKQVFINIHPEIQVSFHRKQKRFIVACGTVLIALSIIITIIIYVTIMTIKHKTEMNQLHFSNYPR